MSIAVLIGLEEYAADDIEGVRFARNDVEQFAVALAALGFDSAAQRSLVSGAATKAAMESTLRKAIGSLSGDDAFYLYYSGHGLRAGVRNFLTCHDTTRAELQATSIELDWVFGLLMEAGCQKVVVFLDSCHRGLAFDGEATGLLGDRADGELEEFFGHGGGRVCFASCEAGQVSWGSRRSKHGAWAVNVIDAIRGNAPSALENGTSLTSASLQLHLASAVQNTLRGDFVEKRDQTPWACGSISSDFTLGDFGAARSSRIAATEPKVAQVPRLSFCGETHQAIKKLSGFKKHQRVPTDAGNYAEAFARNASNQEIDEDLESVYRRLRDAFDLRRRDLEKVGPEDGGGAIVCPYFTYHVHVALDPGDLSRVIFHREIGDINEPGQILGGPFQSVFGASFGSLRFSPPVQIDLEEFIDRMEEMGDDLQSLDFDPAGTRCNVRLRGVDASIRVTATEICLVHDSSREPRALVEAFSASRQYLVETEDVRRINFEGTAEP